MFNATQFEKIPADHLRTIGSNTAHGGTATQSTAQGGPESPGEPGAGNQLEDDLNKAAQHTQNTGAGTPGTSATPGASEPPKSAKKTLSQLSGGKGGKFMTNIMDFVIPALLCFVVGRLGYTIDKEVFKLTKDERDLLEPVMQEVLDTIYVDLNNPVAQFALCAGMIYGAKFMDAWDKIEKKQAPVAQTTQMHVDWQMLAKEEYNREYVKLLEATAKKKKCSPAKAKAHLESTGQLDMLKEKITNKYQPKQAA